MPGFIYRRQMAIGPGVKAALSAPSLTAVKSYLINRQGDVDDVQTHQHATPVSFHLNRIRLKNSKKKKNI